MVRTKSSHGRQGLALAFCLMMVFPSNISAARTSLRAGHILDQDHHDQEPVHDHDATDQYQKNNHHALQSLIRNSQMVVTGNYMNRSFTSSRMLGQMSEKDIRAIENFYQFNEPLKDVQSRLMKKASEMDPSDIVEKLGDKVPVDVASLVKTDSMQSVSQPLSEAQLDKARNVLNGMVYDALLELDAKLIECKEFEIMNRNNLGQVQNDLARLASQITSLSDKQLDAQATIDDSDNQVEELDKTIEKETKAYNDQKAINDAEMVQRRSDVAIAEFILSVTICKDKMWPHLKLVQEGSTGPGYLGVMKCEGDHEEFRFADPATERQAETTLTPEARIKLQKWLRDVHEHAMLQTESKDAPDSADDDEDEDALDEPNPVPVAAAHAQLQFHRSSQHKEDPPKKAPPTMPPPVAGPPKPTVPPTNPEPDPLKPPKCVLSKINCGLLHDNMSLLWGKWKDLVDELQAEMDENKEIFDELMADLNTQRATYVSAKETAQSMKAEAIAMTNADVAEQKDKQAEERFLHKQYKKRMGICIREISEIFFTDICGVKVIRGLVAAKSKKIGCPECPEQIVDCEVGDWIPGLCTVPCDDDCNKQGMKMSDPTSFCGGKQPLSRSIVIKDNAYGIKCVPLTNERKCSQFLCPVNCKMTSFSGFTKCTKECEQGMQFRTRTITIKPKNGGEQCEATQESQSCNTGSCDRHCTLKKWTTWSACSQACGAGRQERFKHIKVPTRGAGKCPKPTSKKRFTEQKCNTQPCVGDEECIAKMDLILALDGSGSLKDSGYTVIKDFVVEYIKLMKSEAYGRKAVRIGAIQFGNGMILKEKGLIDSLVSASKMIVPIKDDLKDVSDKISKTVWEKGFTNLAQVFPEADKMFMSGRKKSFSQLIIFSDGKPSFKFSTMNEAKKLKDKNVNVFFININAGPKKEDVEFIKKEVVSQPWNVNYLQIPGVGKLSRELLKWARLAVVQTCPKAVSPTKQAATEEAQGFKFVKEGMQCGQTKGSEIDKDPLHVFLGVVASPMDCMVAVAALEKQYFTFGTETGPKPNNAGKCYAEMTKDGAACPEGWVDGPTDYYEVLPIEDVGGDTKK